MTKTDPTENQENEIMTADQFMKIIDAMDERLIDPKDKVDRDCNGLEEISFYDHDTRPPTPRIVLQDGKNSLHIFFHKERSLILYKKPMTWEPEFPKLLEAIQCDEGEFANPIEILGFRIENGHPTPVALVDKRKSDTINTYPVREVKITDDNEEELGQLLQGITGIIQSKLDALDEETTIV